MPTTQPALKKDAPIDDLRLCMSLFVLPCYVTLTMPNFSFIHCADLHLDSPLRGLRRMQGAPDIQQATRNALEQMIQLALDQQVAFVLIAGDLYDGDWPDYHTGLFFAAQMRRLEDQNIQVFMVYGNHDAQSQISKQLRLPNNVTVFDTKKPETHCIEALQVALHGQSFAIRDVVDNLAAEYPLAETGYLNIGVLHTALTGRAGHANYAPCSLDDLRSKGYDYWALGHVHQYEEVCQDPWVVYSGNLQGRHSRETGDKGCVLVQVQDLSIQSVQHHALQFIRWQHVQVDVSSCEDEDALFLHIQKSLADLEDEQGILRLTLTGESCLHHQLKACSEPLQAEFINHMPTHWWLEKVKICTTAAQQSTQQAPRLETLTDMQTIDPSMLQSYAQSFQALKKKLPATVLKDVDPCDPEHLKMLLQDASSILQARLGDTT